MGAAERVRIQEVDAFGAARVQLSGMEKRLSSPEMMNATHGQLEEYVIEQGRELERLLLQAHMDLRAAREERVEVRGADGVRRTMTRASMRPVMTLVAEVNVERLAYQAREVPGLHPMDAALNLPREQYSHGVRRFVAKNAALLSFDDVRHLLLKQTGARVPERQLEELAVRSAVDFDAFYAQRRGLRPSACDGAAHCHRRHRRRLSLSRERPHGSRRCTLDAQGSRGCMPGTSGAPILRLRALRTSGDFDAYWDYHLCEERRRHHAERFANTEIPQPNPTRASTTPHQVTKIRRVP